jgi:cbb3-type cytochrome oxidase cytochrome c subunit
MKYGPLVFLAAFFALAASWSAFVLAPQVQLGRGLQTNTVGTAEIYPQLRPGMARQGLEVYRANGCAACHSQQVGQTGIECNLVITDLGTNMEATAKALIDARLGFTNVSIPWLRGKLSKPLVQGLVPDRAQAAAKTLKSAGAKVSVEVVPLGPDISRGWGNRRTVAQDFLYDETVMLGALRVGPDLANIGLRSADPNWHLRHLYAPAAEREGSVMPAYQFLFDKRPLKPGQAPSPNALKFEKASVIPAGFEVVPRPEARALVEYLLSLRANVPLFETPMSVAAAPPAAAPANAPAQ